MKKKLFVLLVIFAFSFISCKTSTDSPNGNSTDATTKDSRESNSNTENYPKLKVENKMSMNIVYSIELPNHNISPVEIQPGEDMIFELCNPMFSYENVTARIGFGISRNATNYIYVRKNFSKGQTTVITLNN